ncbi:hypothetical protein KSP40_PGU005022 [Platanthera guangdongensis]|uniref:ACT domain-containing protein n=1 Tax=Platanthera guangdongensis TaxID=2320717 RepID=A0ABR2MF87_9ASPA
MGTITVSPSNPATSFRRRTPDFPNDSLSALTLPPRKIFVQSFAGGKLVGRPCSGAMRIRSSSERVKKAVFNNHIFASVADVSLNQATETFKVPKGEMWSVHKFGGTCMGTAERIQKVAEIVQQDSSERKLVIVSAMSKVTDMMYNLLYKAQSRDDSYTSSLDDVFEKHLLTAKELLEEDDLERFLSELQNDISNLKTMLRAIYIAGHATESFSDFVVGHGELWSAQMLSYAIEKNGKPCCWMDTREVLIVDPISSNQVDPNYEESEKKLEKWFAQRPPETIIATGFIASTPQNIPTTLKRDGSDFSAAILGALVMARQVTIWTDVDGVFSADPRKVSEAVILRTLSYQEAWEMSYFGANVLHPRTIIPVMKYNIPIIIRNIFNLSAPGTMICQQHEKEDGEGMISESVVKAFATIDNLALVNVEGTGMAGVPGTASDIFGAVKDVGANVIMISQASSEHSICFAVPEKEVKAVSNILQSRFRQALDAGRLSQVEVVHNCSILAAVGQKMASTPGVSATLFDALAKANINVRAIAQGCSEYNITVVLMQDDCVRALRAAHSRFYLSKTTLAVGLIGPGLIGGTLLDQLRDQAAVLKESFNIDLRVMGISGTKSMALSNSGIDLMRWREHLKEKAEKADLEKFVRNVQENHFFPNTVLVDCTADSDVANHYCEWLQKGIHVITPNKKANSGPLDREKEKGTDGYTEAQEQQQLEYNNRRRIEAATLGGTTKSTAAKQRQNRHSSSCIVSTKARQRRHMRLDLAPSARDTDKEGDDGEEGEEEFAADTKQPEEEEDGKSQKQKGDGKAVRDKQELGMTYNSEYLKLRKLQRKSYTHYFYEATVGAGLPIIRTLQGLLETGDKILQIEGIFSGTLSYIFNNFKGTRSFSDVVTEAKLAGYTEPDPRDDLSGSDVARKVIILARESGLKLELSDIPVQNLVPEQLRDCASSEEFMQKLPNFDDGFSKQRNDAEVEGEVLRYVGVVDVANNEGAVELRRYGKTHPFAQLWGSDNIIAFTTQRYREQPLIVRGPGAGAEVTAGGVFSDILRLASYLGAPS